MDKKIKEMRYVVGKVNGVKMTVDAIKLKQKKNDLKEVRKRIKVVTKEYPDTGYQMVLAEILSVGLVSKTMAVEALKDIVDVYEDEISVIEKRIVNNVKSI